MNFNKKLLIKQSQTLKALEEHAEEMYTDIVKGLSDTKMIEIIDLIRRDEQKHQRIMQEIIDILETSR